MAAKDYVCRYDKVMIFCAWFESLYLFLLLHLWYLARVSLFTITDYRKTIYIRFNRELINGQQCNYQSANTIRDVKKRRK